MEKFAKVFESHGRQFLVMKNTDDEGEAKLSIITRIDGTELDLGLIFHDSEYEDEGFDEMDKAFKSFEEENIEYMAKLLEGVKTPFEAVKALKA